MAIIKRLLSSLSGGNRRSGTRSSGRSGVSGGLIGAIKGFFRGSSGRRV